MTPYLELTRIARAIKAATWRGDSGHTAHDDNTPAAGGDRSFPGPRVPATSMTLATTSAGPP